MAELDRGRGNLRFQVSEPASSTVLVRLEGELDMMTTPELEAGVGEALQVRPQRLVIDAGGLQFADSSAIALLVRWANLIPEVEIRQPPELLRRVIARMGLSERLEVRP